MGDIECLGNLNKYLPFIEFLLKNGSKEQRLVQIRKWIHSKTNVQKAAAVKIHGLLVHHYRELHLHKTETPPWVDALFNNPKCESIDLCDDDDSDVEVVENKETSDNSTKNNCDAKLFERRNQVTESSHSNSVSNSNDTVLKFPAECKRSPNPSVVEVHQNILLTVLENVLDSKDPDMQQIECKPYPKEEPFVYVADNHNNEFTGRFARIYDDFSTQRNATNNINFNTMYQNQGYYPNSVFPTNSVNRSATCLRINRNDPRIKSSGQSKIYGPKQQEMPHMQSQSLSLPYSSGRMYDTIKPTAELRPNLKSITYGEYKRQKLLKESQSKLSNNTINLNASLEVQSSINKDCAKASLHPGQNYLSKGMESEIVKKTQSKNFFNQDNKIDRVLKQLHMDFNGYNQLEDFMFPTGKRSSSISASTAISEQINLLERDDDPMACNKKGKIVKRRKSMCEKKSDLIEDSHMRDLSSTIRKRRLSLSPSSQMSYKHCFSDIEKPIQNLSEKNERNVSEEPHISTTFRPLPKRRASISASNAIAMQLKGSVSTTYEDQSDGNDCVRQDVPKPLPKRRASISPSNVVSMQVNGTNIKILEKQSEDNCFMQDISKSDKTNHNDSPPKGDTRKRFTNSTMEVHNTDVIHEKIQQSIVRLKKLSSDIQLQSNDPLKESLLPPKDSSSKESKVLNIVNTKRKALSPNIELVHRIETLPLQPTTSKSNFMMQRNKQMDQKNINPNMTEQNSKTCVLCLSKPHNLTNHYVGRHKTESYVSRLSLKKLQNLQINIPYATCVSINNFTQYLVKCAFCNEIITNEFLKLYDHFSYHTGEYAYKCGGCGLQKPYASEIATHKEKSKKCYKKKTLTLYSYNPYQMVIEIFWCQICNFVQLNAANIGKHIVDQHERNPNSLDIKRLVLVAIQNEPNVVNEPFTDDDYINETAALNETTNTDYNSIITTDNHTFIPGSDVDLDERGLENYFDIENVKRELDVTIDNHFMEIDNFENELDIKPDITKLNDYEFGDDTDIDYGYKSIPAGTSYFGLFKCMGAECFYSTDVDFEFTNHIQDHKDSNCPEIDILYCAYCNNDCNGNKYDSAEDLIAHIKECHENSIYHCNYCCYRSCVPGNILIHHESNHGQKEVIVVECGIKQVRSNHNAYILNRLKRNVDELVCKYCSATFYAVSSISSHIENTHGIEVNPIEFKSLSCVYCFENFFEFGNIELHLANKHPNEEPYICQRELRKPVQVETVCDLICKPISKYVPKDKIISWPDQNLSKSNEELTTNEESTESLLYQLTQNTGVPPDHLYLCPNTNCRGIFSTFHLWFQHITRRHGSTAVSCPYSQHCKKFELMELSEFENHFPNHCLHRYVCFQCGKTFRYDYSIYGHCSQEHNNGKNDLRFEKIIMNERFCYFIAIQKYKYIDKVTFTMNLQMLIKKRFVDIANQRNVQIVSCWTVPLSAKWIEAFPKYANITETSKCKINACTFVGNSIDTFKHIKLSHKNDVDRDFTYGCNVCKYYEAKLVDDNSVNSIEDHIKMHEDNLYICCLCLYFHYNKNNMSMHCYKVHNHLDVPIVNLIRSNTITKMSLTIVFGLEQITFSTVQTCFCCHLNLSDLKQIYDKHLTTDHNLQLKYACEYCNETIECLSKSQQHFTDRHPLRKLKINCQVNSFYEQDLIIESLDPLAIRIASNLLDYTNLTANIKQENESY